MVAVIHASSSLRNALNYNEQKVIKQVGTCLAAVHYPKDMDDLNFYQKLNRLQNQAALNVRTKVNSVHISLNFDPSERLSEERLKEIADNYLQKIGFAKQPYLLYQHQDRRLCISDRNEVCFMEAWVSNKRNSDYFRGSPVWKFEDE